MREGMLATVTEHAYFGDSVLTVWQAGVCLAALDHDRAW